MHLGERQDQKSQRPNQGGGEGKNIEPRKGTTRIKNEGGRAVRRRKGRYGRIGPTVLQKAPIPSHKRKRPPSVDSAIAIAMSPGGGKAIKEKQRNSRGGAN